MSRIATTFATAGAAALLVVASFTAGAASSPGATSTESSQAQAAPTPPDGEKHRDSTSADEPMALPGPDTPAELLYVPVPTCRAVDTRPSTRFGDGTGRNYYIAGTVGFAAQNGASAGCKVPTGATSVVVKLFAVGSSAAGRLKSWPSGSAEPSGSVMYYTKSVAGSLSQVTLPIRGGAGADVAIRNVGGPTDVVIDVVGYYMPQMYAYIASSGSALDQSGRLVSATKTGTGTYTLEWDRDVTNCAGVGSSDLTGHIVSVYTSGTNTYVYTVNNAGAAEDYWFNVVVTC